MACTGQANLAATAAFASTDDLYQYLTDKIGSLPGILAMETSLVLRKTKQLTYEPRRPARTQTPHT